MNRRELLQAAATLPLTALPGTAFAQAAYPTRNITMIVPFPAGGQADLAARPVALALERFLGKPVIVDNRAGGAGGSIGNAQAAQDSSFKAMNRRMIQIADIVRQDPDVSGLGMFGNSSTYNTGNFFIVIVVPRPTSEATSAGAPFS